MPRAVLDRAAIRVQSRLLISGLEECAEDIAVRRHAVRRPSKPAPARRRVAAAMKSSRGRCTSSSVSPRVPVSALSDGQSRLPGRSGPWASACRHGGAEPRHARALRLGELAAGQPRQAVDVHVVPDSRAGRGSPAPRRWTWAGAGHGEAPNPPCGPHGEPARIHRR